MKAISKSPFYQVKKRHSSLQSAIEGAILFIINFSPISFDQLLKYARQERALTRSQVQKAVDALVRSGRIRLETILDCIIVRAARNGGAR